jgi:hypothetical protein
MEEASGTRVDSTTHARNLTPGGWSTLPTNDTGIIGNGAKCLSNGYQPGPRFTISDCPTLTSDGKFTFAFWVKTNNLNNGLSEYFNIVAFDSPGSYSSIYFRVLEDNATWGNYKQFWDLGLGYWDYPGYDDYHGIGFQVDPDDHAWSANTWHFICIWYDGTGLYLSVDDVLWGSHVGTHGITQQPNRLRLSEPREGGTCNWSDEFGIWDFALSAAQRTYLYNSGNGIALY